MTKQLRPVPTKVTLERDLDEVAYVRVYADNVRNGYFNLDSIHLRTGACITRFRKKAKAYAKSLDVPFEDKLGPSNGRYVKR
jgi:hypothetical protein